MPVVTDKVVIPYAYETSNNGGRKVVVLDNGWIVAVVRNGMSHTNFIVDKQDGKGFVQLCWLVWNIQDIAIVSKGNIIYALFNNASVFAIASLRIDATTVTNTDQTSNAITVDNNQTAIGNVSLAINDKGTELHAEWMSKNAVINISSNRRYRKGIILANGGISWGPMVQVTADNNYNVDWYTGSVIVRDDGEPVIFSISTSSGYDILHAFSPSGLHVPSVPGFAWSYTAAHNPGHVHKQVGPSGLYVPKRLNGLTDGLVAVAWHGYDTTHPNNKYVRFIASRNKGKTYGGMKKIVEGENVSLTANNSGHLFIEYERSGNIYFVKSTDHGETWGSEKLKGTGSGPSTVLNFDLTDVTVPLSVRKKGSSVVFNGTWEITNISVPQGPIGKTTDRDKLLSYAITSDVTMSTITEKVNGLTVGTKTAVSGDVLDVSLTQEQWNDVKFGGYGAEIQNILPLSQTDWEQGTYINTTTIGVTPTLADTTTIVRLKQGFIPVTGNKAYETYVPSSLSMVLFETDGRGKITKGLYAISAGKSSITPMPSTARLYVLIQKSNYSTIVPSDVSASLSIKGEVYFNNNLVIEMGANRWEYMFNKQLPLNSDLITIATSMKDMSGVSIPGVKSDLIDTIISRGGIIVGDSFEDIRKAIESIEFGTAIASDVLVGKTIGSPNGLVTGTFSPGKKVAFGQQTATGSGDIIVANLDFKPSYVALYGSNWTSTYYGFQMKEGNFRIGNTFYDYIETLGTSPQVGNFNAYFGFTDTGFKLRLPRIAGITPQWMAVQ